MNCILVCILEKKFYQNYYIFILHTYFYVKHIINMRILLRKICRLELVAIMFIYLQITGRCPLPDILHTPENLIC